MKRKMTLIAVILFLFGIALAESNLFYYYYTGVDWFSSGEAEVALVPEGLTERETAIYRAGYANGHYDGRNPKFVEGLYVLNTKTKKFHLSNCMTTLQIELGNREHSTKTPAELMSQGYKPCGQCNPEREHPEFAHEEPREFAGNE